MSDRKYILLAASFIVHSCSIQNQPEISEDSVQDVEVMPFKSHLKEKQNSSLYKLIKDIDGEYRIELQKQFERTIEEE